MGIESTVTKENFCELVAIAYMGAMSTAILIDGVDVIGLEWNGEPVAPFWSMLVVIGSMFTIWVGCSYLRIRVP